MGLVPLRDLQGDGKIVNFSFVWLKEFIEYQQTALTFLFLLLTLLLTARFDFSVSTAHFTAHLMATISNCYKTVKCDPSKWLVDTSLRIEIRSLKARSNDLDTRAAGLLKQKVTFQLKMTEPSHIYYHIIRISMLSSIRLFSNEFHGKLFQILFVGPCPWQAGEYGCKQVYIWQFPIWSF